METIFAWFARFSFYRGRVNEIKFIDRTRVIEKKKIGELQY